MKLAAPAADLPKLERALSDLAAGPAGARSSLVTTYYDTADLALSRRGLSLRVRETDGRFVQTVKANGGPQAGVLTRGEWEDEIAGKEPDLRAPQSGRHLPRRIAKGLKPLFATAVTRTAISLAPSPSVEIEAAIDEGEIRGIAKPAAAPISEIELELKRGDPGRLFDVALHLLNAAPLRIEARSKSERGYAVVAGEAAPARPVSAEPVALDAAMTVETAFRRIGRACVTHLMRNEAATLAGDPEGVHQMRIALRRIRAAITTFGKVLPAAARRLSGDVQRLDKLFGAARNLDVFAGDLLAPARAALGDDPGLDRLATALDSARQAAHARVRELILSPRYTACVLRLLHGFEGRDWPTGKKSERLHRPLREVARRLLSRRRREVRKRGERFRRASAKDRHRLRIALKQLRYAGEFLAGFYDPVEARAFIKQLKQLQDGLGYENDVRVGRDIIADLSAQAGDKAAVAEAGAHLLAWHQRRTAAARRGLRRRLRRLEGTTPFWKRGYSAAVSIPAGQATPVLPSPQ